MLMGKFSMLYMDKYWISNLAIWSRWSSYKNILSEKILYEFMKIRFVLKANVIKELFTKFAAIGSNDRQV